MTTHAGIPADELDTPAQFLKGAGPKRAEALSKLGLLTVRDVLFNLPRDVLDLTHVKTPGQLTGKDVETVRGRVVDFDARSLSRGRTLTGVLLDCGGEYVRGTWFNQPWVRKRFPSGQVVLFSGKPKWHQGRWEFSHPRVQTLGDDEAETGGIQPCYGLTEGLSMEALRAISRNAVAQYAHLVPDPFPASFREEIGVPHLADAVTWLHSAATLDQFEAARQRVLLEDLLEFQLGLAMRRRAWREESRAPKLELTAKIDARIRRLITFQLTRGQEQAICEIASDLRSGRAMHRLLQADVGAGKTVVAIFALLTAIAYGYQAAIMAPTEVLANQHWQTIDNLLKHSRVRRCLLTGRLTASRRKRAHEGIAAGEIDLVIGTQALIQNAVNFARLAVVVIDEQHKFGVAQRARFSADLAETATKDGRPGGPRDSARIQRLPLDERPREAATATATGMTWERNAADQNEEPSGTIASASEFSGPVRKNADLIRPHVLVMTATPIPRSLCLTAFGDLDLTTIHELPPGRQRVVTSRVLGAGGRKKAWEFLRKQLAGGRQAYVICPRVEETAEDRDAEVAASVEAVYRTLQETELHSFRVGLVHGRMTTDEKEAAMQAFRDHETDVLVSTTVVEVGVDVPNATLMVIHQAEAFGLSQLHQLRGRVARGKYQGYCFLFTESASDEANSRLGVLEQTSDGFRIAEADFEFRGPGDVLGLRQSGTSPLRHADLQRDVELVERARAIAEPVVDSGRFDTDEFAPLKQRILERFGQIADLPKTG